MAESGTPQQAHSWHLGTAAARKRVPGPHGRPFAELFQHGTLQVEIYAPRGSDDQQPHALDELYVVISGAGEFQRGQEKVSFVPGDLLFVPAGIEHRFVRFSPDFATWVIFYGPEGGEGA